MMDSFDRFSNTIFEIIKVISVSLGSVFVSLNVGLTIDIFAQTIWKAIAPIGAFIYTLYKIISDVYDRIKNYINRKRDARLK